MVSKICWRAIRRMASGRSPNPIPCKNSAIDAASEDACEAATAPGAAPIAGDEPIACIVLDVLGRGGSGDRDFHPATATRAAGRLHERTARAVARIRRHGAARSAPLRRDLASRAGAL